MVLIAGSHLTLAEAHSRRFEDYEGYGSGYGKREAEPITISETQPGYYLINEHYGGHDSYGHGKREANPIIVSETEPGYYLIYGHYGGHDSYGSGKREA